MFSNAIQRMSSCLPLTRRSLLYIYIDILGSTFDSIILVNIRCLDIILTPVRFLFYNFVFILIHLVSIPVENTDSILHILHESYSDLYAF